MRQSGKVYREVTNALKPGTHPDLYGIEPFLVGSADSKFQTNKSK